MAAPVHPMSKLKGTEEGRALMAHVRAQRKPAPAKPSTSAPANAVPDEADTTPISEKDAARKYMTRRSRP